MKLVYILSSLILAGCALNKVYLHPFKVDPKKLNYFDDSLKTTVYVTEGENYQPFFHDSLQREVELKYQVESVLFPNRKGKNIHGWFIEPKENEKDVMLYFLHGNAGNIYYQYMLMLPFVERGYSVFMIDYSGFGHSEGKAKRKFVYTDALDGFSYLKSRTDKQKSKLLLYGQSLGGHAAASVSPTLQDSIDGVIIEGAFSSHEEIAMDRINLGWFTRLCVKEQYAGIDSIQKLKDPLVIVHSTEDKTIPYWMGEKYDSLAPQSHEFITIDGRHILGPLLYPDTIFNAMEKMIGN